MQPIKGAELMQRLVAEHHAPAFGAGWRALAGLTLAGIAADSRRVRPGFLFAALPSLSAQNLQRDGRTFIADAVANGAAAILAPPGTVWPPGVPPRPMIEDAEPRRRLAELASAFAGPAPRTIAAVTGTNGKTSTVEFLRQIWAAAGEPAASLGTLGLISAEDRIPGALTTPDPVVLAETMASLARRGVERVAIEASSHGLDQFRLDGLSIAAGGFSSFSRDHLDYHHDLETYRRAKLRLFAELLPEGAPAVVSARLDPATLAALSAIAERRRLSLETVGAGGSLLCLERAIPVAAGQLLDVSGEEILFPLPGRFQAENALLAAGLALVLGAERPVQHLARLRSVRGRLERAAILGNGAVAYVDYAHTPDAITNLIAALRPHTERRLVIVFGAGGDRDPGKRPAMGRAAASGSDRIIVTDDNPRSEDPALIRRAVLAGCPGAIEIGDRKQAIAAALADLGPGDVLAVAGKGHEEGQIVGDHVLPFDDVAVIRELAGQS